MRLAGWLVQCFTSVCSGSPVEAVISNEYQDDENADKVHPKSPRGRWPNCFPTLVIALACIGVFVLVAFS